MARETNVQALSDTQRGQEKEYRLEDTLHNINKMKAIVTTGILTFVPTPFFLANFIVNPVTTTWDIEEYMLGALSNLNWQL